MTLLLSLMSHHTFLPHARAGYNPSTSFQGFLKEHTGKQQSNHSKLPMAAPLTESFYPLPSTLLLEALYRRRLGEHRSHCRLLGV